MNKTEAVNCQACGAEFIPFRSDGRFCKNETCLKNRQKARWDSWRERREAEGTYRDKANEYQRKFRQRTGYHKDYELRTKYGITLDEWIGMVEAVEGCCQICGRSDKTLCVDHDHLTNRVRGVLCTQCNRAIGQLGDTEEHLRNALNYLLKARGE